MDSVQLPGRAAKKKSRTIAVMVQDVPFCTAGIRAPVLHAGKIWVLFRQVF